jgi:DNA protecting protein DprA
MTAISNRDRDASIALALLDAPGLGPSKVLDLLTKWGSAAAAFDRALDGEGVSKTTAAHLGNVLPDNYLPQLDATRALGGDIKLWSDDSYPRNLSKWTARPPVLYYKGQIDALSTRALALVGRVDPTERGKDAAARFARLCVDNNIDVVSGLAKGIDGASHRSALVEPSGMTYAVIAHGLDSAYPAENHDLYEMIPNHGAVISQFPIGMGPQRWTFPARNEAMCTLALGTVIIEGKAGCGSIIQADFSFKHGRPVFILSRNLRSDDPAWALELVKKGAHVIETFEQANEIVERTHGELWGEKIVQGSFFDVRDLQPELPETTAADFSQHAPRAALFDLDGVVISTMLTERTAIAEIASRHLSRVVGPDEVLAIGSPKDKLQALKVPNAYAVYQAEYQRVWEKHLDLAEVFQEMVLTIDRLLADGWKVGAITSQNARRAGKMIPVDIRARFEIFLTYADVQGKKAVGITRALKQWNVAASNAFYIGDQTADVVAAKAAGVTSVAALWGFESAENLLDSGPDLVLDTPESTHQLLGLF